MIGQTLAIFLDGYRELNSRKMFWIVLILSGLVVLAFAAAGIDEQQNLSLLGMSTAIPIVMPPAEFYTLMFVVFGIEIWLAFAATILAIISTASIFPDFISGGSIDLYLSKPISRARLFLTKYLSGLLFVGLQVTVFCIASFLVIGIRGGAWEPRIFLGVPIVVCFFSYLYAISTLFGIVTRSTVGAVLLTLLAWGLIFALHGADVGLLTFKIAADRQAAAARRMLPIVEQQIESVEKRPVERRPFGWQDQLAENIRRRDELRATLDSNAQRNLRIAHRIVFGMKTVLPKTSETTALLSRYLLSEPPPPDEDVMEAPRQNRRRERPFTRADEERMEAEIRQRPVSWVIGTSLLFEAAVLVIAGWVFCRRDY